MINALISSISSRIKISEEEVALISKYFHPVLYAKNTVIEEEGSVPRYMYYVVSGFVRLFHYNREGDEITTHINCPPGFITSYVNFSRQTSANESVECITDCELLRITKADLDLITGKSIAIKDFSIQVFNEALAYNETRSVELASLSADQRYKNLIKNYPEILHNVPIQYIASFLGMKPQSLSRIRRNIIK